MDDLSSVPGAVDGRSAAFSFLGEGGETGELIRSFDWSRTSLGPIETWPQSLRTATAMLLASPVPIVMLWDPDGFMIYNDAYSVFAGGRHPQLLGSKVREGWPEVADFNDNVMKVGLAGGTLSYKDQELTLHRHGKPEQVWMNLDYSPVLDEAGEPAGVIAIVIETTERVLAERGLRESEGRLRIATEAANIGTWDFDPVSGRLSWDDRCKTLFGMPAGARIDYDVFLAGLHPDDREATDAAVRLALDPDGPGGYDVEYRTIGVEDGVERWIAATGRAQFAGNGTEKHAVRFSGTVIDISDKKHTAEALLDAEERYRLAALATQDGIWDWDLVNDRVLWNEALYKNFLHRPENVEPVGSWWIGHIHPDDRDRISNSIHAVIDGDQSAWTDEYRFQRGDGSYAYVYDRGTVVRDETGKAVRMIGAMVDETARLEAQAALIEQQRVLETLNRTGEDLARELELQKVVQMVTDAGVELSGAEFGAFFYNVLDDKGESYLLYSLSGAEPSQFNFGMPRNTKIFAPTFEGEGTVRSDDITKDPRYGQNAPRKGMPEGHLPVCSYLAVPVVSRSGEVIGGLFFGHHKPARFTETHEQLLVGVAAQAAIAIDNARLYQAVQRANETLEHRVEERTAELETANEALRQAQKMEAIGQLTGGIAHDFNNMLTVIRGSADVLQRRELEPDKRQRYLQAIAETSDRAARLTSQLLAFARRQALKPEVFSAPSRVEAITDMLRTVLGGRIKLGIENLCEDCFVEADAAQFETALLNMAVNARDAMDSEGELTISIGQSDTPEGAAAAEHGYVTVAVTDSGHGISPDDLDRIFEPFFTTKETGKGTGLGLSQVYGFAKQSGGEVRVTSKVGEGTTFTMFLPRVIHDGLGLEKESKTANHEPRDGRVLVVEDNDEVGHFAEQVLADLGYRTRRAANAVEALSLLDDGEDFDVVFSDIVMPGQSGIDLAHTIRKRWPRLPIVLTSGYSDALAMRPDDNFPLLHKPYSLDALSAALSEALKR